MKPIMMIKKERLWLTLLALLTLMALLSPIPSASAQTYRSCPPPYDAANYGSPLDLSECDLSGANLYNSDLRNADLSGANLSKAVMYNTNLANANLYGANLSGVDLYNGGLDNANLTNANLSKAALYNATLVNTNLTNADLTGVDFTEADLSGATLSGATLSNITWSNTTCPDGSNSNANTPETCFPDTTAPVISPNVSGTLGNNRWYISDVTVSWAVSDPESGIVSTHGCETQTFDYDTFGSDIVCRAANGAGQETETTFTSFWGRDATPPIVSVTNVEDGASYILGSVPTAGCDTTDAFSGVATNASLTITGGNSDGTGTFTATCDGATDLAGNMAAPASVSYTVEIPDNTPPMISANVSGTQGNNGWYISNVEVSWTVSDDESDISSATGCETTLIDSDTAGASLTCEASSAGGTDSASVNIQRDATSPVVSVTGVEDGAQYILGAVPTAGCDTQDTLSGVATEASLSLSGGNSNGVGSFTATCDGASDNAGNTGSASVSYSVIYDFGGFTAPIDPQAVNQVKAGQTVPVKFSLNGDQGLNIFATGYPTSQEVACDGSTSINAVEETGTAGNSGLSYDSDIDQYSYNWKTDKGWSGTCRQLIVQFDDGSEYSALFQFK